MRVHAAEQEKRLKGLFGDKPVPPAHPRDEDGRHLGIRYRRPPEPAEGNN